MSLSVKLADKARDVYARELALKSYIIRHAAAAAAAASSETIEMDDSVGGGSDSTNGGSDQSAASVNGRDKDKETMESDLQRDFEMLVRNIYAFYPLLIKYVDIHRAQWLRHVEPNAERLFMQVADIFNIWLKSKMFKKEESNFVVINNIDNVSTQESDDSRVILT